MNIEANEEVVMLGFQLICVWLQSTCLLSCVCCFLGSASDCQGADTRGVSWTTRTGVHGDARALSR